MPDVRTVCRRIAVVLATAGALGTAGAFALSPRAVTAPTIVTATGGSDATATCPSESYVTGGGYRLDQYTVGTDDYALAAESRPTDDGTGWYAFLATSGDNPRITVYAVCTGP
ncbi:hypothetical protein [Kitasatospora griseola]|uniref:hypothetical protein n=1 Tax=Kitasatospora griseola TaxID=2064 RepID=UPI00341ADC6A